MVVTHEGSLRVVSHQDGLFLHGPSSSWSRISMFSHQGGLLVSLIGQGTLSSFRLVSSQRVLSSIGVVSHHGGFSLMSMVSH